MYNYIDRKELVERVDHIRKLHREIPPATEREQALQKRRNQKAKDLLSNLWRTGEHPTLSMVLEFGDMHSLTADGVHRLFGYDLDAIREYDLQLNGSRTHIVESFPFQRDFQIELPLELAPAEDFRRNASLDILVRKWQTDIPIRELDRLQWRTQGAFYIHVGTEDSLGSSIPPGSTALVEPISEEETRQPNPNSIYLLQFRNGYRCSRCLMSRGRLQLLTSDRSYHGPELYPYPSSVRIAGRIRVFALGLPLVEHSMLFPLSRYEGSADLILPNEQPTRSRLFATKHRRFVRSEEEREAINKFLQTILNSKVSERTKRRYRAENASSPHMDTMLLMTLEHFTRYSDALKTSGYRLRDSGRFSLEAMLRANHFSDLSGARIRAVVPYPSGVWEERRKEMIEWSALLSLKFPQLSRWGDRAIRIADDVAVRGVEPHIRPGSWVLLEEASTMPDVSGETKTRGWSRPLYVLRRGVEAILGHLVRDGNSLTLLTGEETSERTKTIAIDELPHLHRVCGALIPV